MINQIRYKRYAIQILTFGVIWFIFGVTYVVLEFGLIGNLTEYPTTGNTYSFKNSLITSIAIFFMGLIQGVLEVFWLKNFFAQSSFWKKIVFKSIFYLLLIMLFIVALTLISNALVYKTSIFDPLVMDSLFQFMQTLSFWSIIFYAGLVLDMALFYSEIEAYLGNGIVFNYMGKYHKPKQETRIFMFLDMKSSTTIAETIGHKKYFDLLKTYYHDMTDAILDASGEVYQYVGDEIVVSWTEEKGIYKNNCIQCFINISKTFEQKKQDYLETFGLVPEFKAGFHIGEVTTGEIGIIKKNVFHTGDVLNTTARIQAECNNYKSKILISEALQGKLVADTSIAFHKLDKLNLRGKKDTMQLYDVVYN